jgi:hypothetical protein
MRLGARVWDFGRVGRWTCCGGGEEDGVRLVHVALALRPHLEMPGAFQFQSYACVGIRIASVTVFTF